MTRTLDEVPVGPAARLYAEGWQSWSPTTWYAAGEPQHRPAATWQHLMRFRPGADVPDGCVQGEGLLVVDPGTGDPVRLYGQVDARDDVASVRAVRHGDRVVVTTADDGDGVQALTAPDAASALARFGERFTADAGVGPLRPAPRVWCSWYRYFEAVTADDVLENVRAFDTHDLPVDVVQVDDGWTLGLGEGLRPRPGFGSLPRVVDAVRGSGRRVGIWLAPFTVGADTQVAREHPDWLVGPAGRNWGTDLVGLDLTHPGVQDHLRAALGGLRDLGVDYVKIDFVYAGAVPGRRYADVTGVAAYREGLRLVRDALGPGAFVLACGAPILPSVGLVDAMRVSPDTFHEGAEDGSAGLRGVMSLRARTWQHGRFWVNDPDCLVARPSFPLRAEWAEVVRRCGGLRSFSDRVAELDAWGLSAVRDLLRDVPPPRPLERPGGAS